MTTYSIRGFPSTHVVLFEYDVGPNVQYKVFDSNNNFVLQGDAIQNQNYPAEYNAVFTIPKTAYVDNDGSKYWIEWYAERASVRDSFLVFPQGEPIPKSSVSIAMNGKPLSSILALPFEATSANANLYTTVGKLLEVIEIDVANVIKVGSSFKYTANFIRPASNKDTTFGRPYIVMWEYETNAGSGTDMYQIYVPHFRELKWISDAKTYLDLLDINDVQPRFRITPEIMMPFIGLALDRINGIGTATGWNVISLPYNLDYALTQCLRHEYINARFIAEKLSDFEYAGAETQLTVNRAEAWQTKMDEIGTWLQENLEKLKNNVIRAGSPGAIAFGRTPVLNWSPMVQGMANWWVGSSVRLLGY